MRIDFWRKCVNHLINLLKVIDTYFESSCVYIYIYWTILNIGNVEWCDTSESHPGQFLVGRSLKYPQVFLNESCMPWIPAFCSHSTLFLFLSLFYSLILLLAMCLAHLFFSLFPSHSAYYSRTRYHTTRIYLYRYTARKDASVKKLISFSRRCNIYFHYSFYILHCWRFICTSILTH